MRLDKPFTNQEWIDFISYCNNHSLIPCDKGDYYECVSITIPLEEAKQNKITELKQARDKSEQLPVTTEKGTFDVDDKSITRINGAITVLNITGASIDWTLADNTIVSVNSNDLQNVIISLAQQSNYVHEKYRSLKEIVNMCTSVEDVDNILW